MPSHNLAPVELNNVTPEALVSFSPNELIKRWEEKLSLNVWDEIGEAYLRVKKNQKISDKDKLECALKLGELSLRLKRSGSADKSKAVMVNVVTMDATQP